MYASLLFLLIALYEADYLVLPRVVRLGSFTLSLALVVLGFLANAFSWRRVLGQFGHDVPYAQALASTGLSVFGKYIPGKIWAIIGRAGYIAKWRSLALAEVSTASVNAQLITLWLGLAFGAIGLYGVGGLESWGVLVAGCWLVLSLVLFCSAPHRIAERIASRMLRREIRLPTLGVASTVSLIPWFALTWILWAGGFYLLSHSLVSENLPLAVGFGFPLAATLGILVVIAPGGLGVREGILVAYLLMVPMPLAEATTISVTARLWFLVGEASVFALGIALRPRTL